MPNDDDIDRLLARGGLSGPQRERIFDEVHRTVGKRKAFRWSRYAAFGAPLAIAAALALVLYPSHRLGGFAAKGTQSSVVEVLCPDGALSACPLGSKLFFSIEGIVAPVFVHAYADPVGSGHERVWYFPTTNGAEPISVSPDQERLLKKAVVIGPEHGSGAYRIHVVLSTAPLSRDEVLAAHDSKIIDSQVVEIQVVDR
jgi:hypothetical protein